MNRRPKTRKVLFISSHFPNRAQPARATYNRQQIAHLAKLCEVKVIAPYAWFPFLRYGNKGARLSDIPPRDTIEGLEVYHPKAFYVPKLARSLYGRFYYHSLVRIVTEVQTKFDFDVIYSNWLYPDVYGSMLIARRFRKPFVACALGTDVNWYIHYPIIGKLILAAIKRSARTFTVSKALQDILVAKGIAPDSLEVLYDGVDHDLFKPLEREIAARALNVKYEPGMIGYIGNLERYKGIDHLLSALLRLRASHGIKSGLYVIGDGPERLRLQSLARTLGLSTQVKFLGRKTHDQIPLWMNLCDIICLPSLTEGVPNVLLEALSCGVPAVASSVGGVPEILSREELGLMVDPEDANALADALSQALKKKWDRDPIRSHALQFSWEDNARRLYEVLFDASEGR